MYLQGDASIEKVHRASSLYGSYRRERELPKVERRLLIDNIRRMHVVGADDGMPLRYARIGCCTLGRTDHESDETIVAAAPCRDDARMEAQMCARAYERCSNVSRRMYVLRNKCM
jgi:hypothetical protein